MTNREFSELAMEVLKKAKSMAKKEAKKQGVAINEKDFQVDIKDDEFGQRVDMWFFSKGQISAYNCTYYIKNVHSDIKINQIS